MRSVCHLVMQLLTNFSCKYCLFNLFPHLALLSFVQLLLTLQGAVESQKLLCCLTDDDYKHEPKVAILFD